MEQLLNAVAELAGLLSPSKVQAIASRIGGTSPLKLDPSLGQTVGSPAAQAALGLLLRAWSSSGSSGDMVAGMLLGAVGARQRIRSESQVELVWTGPRTSFVATRRTDQVLLELIGAAREELFVVSFVAYDVPSVIAAINVAIGRGVRIRILLEASKTEGGTLDDDPTAMMRNRVPSALLYSWADRPHPFTNGRVHAKVAVADDTIAFLTSANLTGHALGKNMEAGILISGGDIPVNLRAHLHALVDTRIIKAV